MNLDPVRACANLATNSFQALNFAVHNFRSGDAVDPVLAGIDGALGTYNLVSRHVPTAYIPIIP